MKMVSLLKSVRKQPYLSMFNKKRNNKGVMWASLISIGVSVLMMMLRKGKQGNITSTIQNFTKNMGKGNMPMMNNAAALTEFAEEFQTGKMQKHSGKQANHNSTESSNEFQSANLPAQGEISKMNDTALTEFSEDLVAKALENK